jgi:hypothetical protein
MVEERRKKKKEDEIMEGKKSRREEEEGIVRRLGGVAAEVAFAPIAIVCKDTVFFGGFVF